MPSAKVDSLTYGPHGLARVDGKVHFLRGVAPGDEVELRVREDHRAYAYADVERLIAAGPSRREPPCPYLPRCGGCPWQQVEYPAQLEAKQRLVEDLLLRIGRLRGVPVLPVIPSASEFAYRRRLSLRVENRQVGFLAAASHDLVPVAHCLLGTPALDGALALVQEWLGGLCTTLKRVEVTAAASDERLVFAAQAEGPFAAADRSVTEAFLVRRPRVSGLTLAGRGWRQCWGDPHITIPLVDGDSLRVRAGSFVQVSDPANAALIETVLRFASVAPHHRALDLYAGAGNLTVPLARRAAEVTAIERAALSAQDGRENVRRLGLANVTFLTGDCARILDRLEAPPGGIDTAVLDPPRGGAAALVPILLRLAPAVIVYVSCNPATLARDLAQLSIRYVIDTVQPIDFFPQTYHVEAVARLRRRGDKVSGSS